MIADWDKVGDDFYYSVTATDPEGNPHTVDPEMVLKKKAGPGK